LRQPSFRPQLKRDPLGRYEGFVTDWLEVRLRLKPLEQGGRKTPVLPRGGYYKPHFRVSAGSEALGVAFTDGPPEVVAGAEATVTVALIYDIDYSALQPGTAFEVLEGLRVIGAGHVVRRWTDERDWHSRASA